MAEIPPWDRFNIDWKAIHQVIQLKLDGLTVRAAEALPGIRWRDGRNSGRSYPLFSYMTFYHLDGDDFDPIVVGLTCVESDGRVQLSGDISGDETGHIYFDQGCEATVEAAQTPVARGAAEIAGRLADQHAILIEALRHRHPEAMPR